MQTWTSKVLRRHCQNQTSFLRISPLPLKVFHSFPDNLTETILHIFRLLFLLYSNLYEVEGLTRFGIGRNYNNCITYKHFSSNFLLLLFIIVIKINPKIFCLNHSWPQVCSVQLLDCKIILLKEIASIY